MGSSSADQRSIDVRSSRSISEKVVPCNGRIETREQLNCSAPERGLIYRGNVERLLNLQQVSVSI